MVVAVVPQVLSMLVDVVVHGVRHPDTIVPEVEMQNAELAAEDPVEEELFRCGERGDGASSASSSSSTGGVGVEPTLPMPSIGENRLRLDFLKQK